VRTNITVAFQLSTHTGTTI